MAVIGELVELLRRWDVWKRVEDTPSRIDELERRVAAIEARFSSPLPSNPCPFCQAGQMRVTGISPHQTFGDMGVEQQTLICDSCGKSRTVMHDPKAVLSPGAVVRR